MYVYINKKKVKKKREKKRKKKNAIVKEKTKLDFHSQIKTPKKKNGKWRTSDISFDYRDVKSQLILFGLLKKNTKQLSLLL